MTTELLGVLLILLLIFLPAPWLGRYIARVYRGERVWTDFLAPLERAIFRLAGIPAHESWTWQRNVLALLVLNGIFLVWAFLFLVCQHLVPFWNPDGTPGMEWTQALNTAVSFMTNTNLQHYSGEVHLAYSSQLLVVAFLQFVSAATGMAACALAWNALSANKGQLTANKPELGETGIGNFYFYFLRSATRVLLPLAVVWAVFLLFQGTPMTFDGAAEIVTVEGDSVRVARGPVAAEVAIKQLGTNGGGYFGPNSTHPFENPTYASNIAETVAILLIPAAMVFAFGYYTNRRRVAWMLFGVMLTCFLCLLIPTISHELGGNPMLTHYGVDQSGGAMEGKEVRFGAAASALWAISTTVTSNGSVNAMHDSLMTLSGAWAMLGMMVNAFFGGVGVGWLNMLIFLVLAVFIAGLMVGRTPELFGKKLEPREVKIAALVFLLHPFLILVFTGIASHLAANDPALGVMGAETSQLAWLNNPGYHGFSEMLYEFTSASANNGSGFEGLGDNTPFWNLTTALVMLLARFLPIIGPVAICGYLAQKRTVPESAGSLRLDTWSFGITLFFVIAILSALAFFPALALGPIAEYLSMPTR